MNTKYEPAALPASIAEALSMAEQRETWAKDARDRDLTGTAREYELTALLLRFYAAAGARPFHMG